MRESRLRAVAAAVAAFTALRCTRGPAAPDLVPPASAVLTLPPSQTPPAPSAAPVGLPAATLDAATAAAIREAALGAIAREDVPGAVIAVVRGGDVVFREAFGLRRKEPSPVPMTVDTVFDLASLTKVLVTAPAVHLLAEHGKLTLAAPVARYLPVFGKNGKEAITIEQLLLHTSGLPADNALVDYREGREAALARIHALAPVSEPGTSFEYSDLGFIVLGELVEKVSGLPFERFAREHFFAPLDMHDTSFNPADGLRARAAPTEPRDGEMLEGRVHDPRAAALAGVAGHAGLFSTASDLARFAVMLLGHGRSGPTQVLTRATVERMTEPRPIPGGSSRSLGWDVRSSFSGAASDLGGYGHTGFTGTSLWVAPRSDVAVIVLSSRLHPDGKGDARRLRREVADAVARGVHREVRPALRDPPRVLNGIDVLERDGFSLLRGHRVALVTNASGHDARGVRTVDLLHDAPGVALLALFSPEHGLRGGSDGFVGDGRDARTGLPVYSLYGKRQRPAADQLQGIDTLVFDVADAGARFFTYETTLGYLLETAAAHHLRVVVLDRPNPIGGVAVEGPVLAPSLASFLGYHPVPVRHGMTLGELAELWNHERAIGAALEVVRIEGWRRRDLSAATGAPWVNPSPNLRSLDAALAYPGLALLEGTNLSVGRGTAHPFEQIGAPWIDGARLASTLAARHLQGVRFTTTAFTPGTSTYAGARCEGVTIHILDRARFEPVRTGAAIARALLDVHPRSWDAKPMARMLGHPATFAAIMRGDAPDTIAATWDTEVATFLALREKYLLYRE